MGQTKPIESTMYSSREFPLNPFPDVQPTEFDKENKKQVTEDYVSENLKLVGWRVYKPFVDTGIDRVITKEVCPNGHTAYNQSLESSGNCTICKSKALLITRYIQVKTRELKGGNADIFGFTLKTKDFRIDPRHFLVLYSDHTNDFLIISIPQYLKFFSEYNSDFHSTPTFKQGNGKLNNWKYDNQNDKWYFSCSQGRISWEVYRNVNGLKTMQDPRIDLCLNELTEEARNLRNAMFRKLVSGRTFSSEQTRRVNEYLNQRYFSPNNVKETRDNTIRYMNSLPSELKASIMNYWRKYKGLVLR